MKRCFSCDIELPGDVYITAGRAYCCSGCAAGGPCSCTYEGQASRAAANGHAGPSLTSELLGLLPPHEDRPRNWE
jgi:hypothetical protein